MANYKRNISVALVTRGLEHSEEMKKGFLDSLENDSENNYEVSIYSAPKTLYDSDDIEKIHYDDLSKIVDRGEHDAIACLGSIATDAAIRLNNRKPFKTPLVFAGKSVFSKVAKDIPKNFYGILMQSPYHDMLVKNILEMNPEAKSIIMPKLSHDFVSPEIKLLSRSFARFGGIVKFIQADSIYNCAQKISSMVNDIDVVRISHGETLDTKGFYEYL